MTLITTRSMHYTCKDLPVILKYNSWENYTRSLCLGIAWIPQILQAKRLWFIGKNVYRV